MNGVFFLHGLDSSGRGTKGRFFEKNIQMSSVPILPELCRKDWNPLASFVRTTKS